MNDNDDDGLCEDCATNPAHRRQFHIDCWPHTVAFILCDDCTASDPKILGLVGV